MGASQADLRQLSPTMKRIRILMNIEILFACFFSTIAWYKWNEILGNLDRTFASIATLGCGLFGCLRGGNSWVSAYSTGLAFGATAIYLNENHLEQLGWAQPWPHYTFRVFACCTCIAGLNAGLFFRNSKQLLLAFAILCTAYLHAWAELKYELMQRHWVWSTSYWLGSLGRTFVVVFVIGFLMVQVPRQVFPDEADAARETFHDAPADKIAEDSSDDSSDDDAEHGC